MVILYQFGGNCQEMKTILEKSDSEMVGVM